MTAGYGPVLPWLPGMGSLVPLNILTPGYTAELHKHDKLTVAYRRLFSAGVKSGGISYCM